MRLKDQLEAMVKDGKEAEIQATLLRVEPDMKGNELDLGHLSRRALLELEELVRQGA